MSAFFSWLAGLPPLAQIPVVIVAFGIVMVLVVFFIEVAPRSGRGYSIMRLCVAIGVPLAVLLILGIEAGAFWVLIIAAILGGGLFWLDYRARGGSGYVIQLFAFLSPALLLLLIGLVYPAVQTFVNAFRSNDGTHFVGLDNFVWVFSGGSTGLIAFINTIVWVIIAPVFATGIGLLYAVFVDRSRGEKVLKVFIFMPVAISLVGASIIFKFFFDYTQDPQIGLLNQVVEWFGGTPVAWLQNYPLNMVMLIIILIWTQTGFAMVLLSSAIKGVPTEQVEAAELDGTNAWQRFWNVTVPGIRPTIIVVWITISIVSLKVYDIIAATTGGQNDSTVLGYEMVKQFEILPPQAGHSAALALLIFILVTPFIWYNARNLKRQREE
ncbi:sugar ABC transporter permease [Microbacterium horticulturae]|uniref:Sugar ABC transporter permease n=1 Tax=Microbacterium horticulturae TaxID=3028316 RepID=A0ABY8BWD8_9MICO|nr:sugar ABC transporter permease [Microbacterium sp. KACC 23027]WEG08516.1 sugar ABC transporter permease [Microbacterium sp. KACC 23027]